MRRFVIDTDTASDDAVALIMALRSPDVAVEALTIVAGNVPLDRCIQNALYTTELCGSSVPVHAGLARPIFREPVSAEIVHGQDGLGDIGLDLTGRTPAEGHAVDVLVEAICGSPGEITLVTLGPLSNVGTALLREPSLAGAVKDCYIMGGTGRPAGQHHAGGGVQHLRRPRGGPDRLRVGHPDHDGGLGRVLDLRLRRPRRGGPDPGDRHPLLRLRLRHPGHAHRFRGGNARHPRVRPAGSSGDGRGPRPVARRDRGPLRGGRAGRRSGAGARPSSTTSARPGRPPTHRW